MDGYIELEDQKGMNDCMCKTVAKIWLVLHIRITKYAEFALLPQEPEEPKEPREPQELREPREPRELKEPQEPWTPREPEEPWEPKGTMDT